MADNNSATATSATKRHSKGPWTKNGVRILASRYKTQLCRTFASTGVCGYGAECMFAHGVEELRTREGGETDRFSSVSPARKSYGYDSAAAFLQHRPSRLKQHNSGRGSDADGGCFHATVALQSQDSSNSGDGIALRRPVAIPRRSATGSLDAMRVTSPTPSPTWVACPAFGRARYMHDPYRAVPSRAVEHATA